MPLNPQSVGQRLGPHTHRYEWKDCVLYALGVGAGVEELQYVYEEDLQVIPSFGIAAIFELLAEMATVTEMDMRGIVHGEQDIVFHNPIPTSGELHTEGFVKEIYDKGEGKGALVIAESVTTHSNGDKLFTSTISVFSRFDGGFGGNNVSTPAFAFPDRAPDHIVPDHPSPNQAALYRLSGDVHPLHIDPEFSRMVGFEAPIVHGLCTYGYACRAAVKTLAAGRVGDLRRLTCRFTKPLYPGRPIETRIWDLGDGKAVYRVVNVESGEILLDRGVMEYGEPKVAPIGLNERVAVVTGAGRGLGRTYALELARRGAAVVVNDPGVSRDGSGEQEVRPADTVVQEILDAGGRAVANYDSVATPEGGQNIVNAAIESFGRLDILVNNAGILRDKSFNKMTQEQWELVRQVHLDGVFFVTKPAFDVMKEQKFGRIVMITSASGLFGNFGQVNYAAAKMGQIGLMNTLNIEGARHNIKVNAVAPVAFSRMTEDILPSHLQEKTDPTFVTPLVVYLCTEEMEDSGHIYNAAMGHFSRVAIQTGAGLGMGVEELPTPEEWLAHWSAVSSLREAREYPDAISCISSFQLQREDAPAAVEEAPALTLAEVFAKFPEAFRADKAEGVQVVFQFELSGDKGGQWYAAVDNGACEVSDGVHASPSCTLKMSAEDFLLFINKQLDPMQAFTSGRLKVTGDMMKSQLLTRLFRL
jgi:NAD(P)-dependent dehydrogenase (short-subunit alcohol dehydrogenase family)/acyl dehydratase/putative sterol carrier protein